jgi:hypothetical protein
MVQTVYGIQITSNIELLGGGVQVLDRRVLWVSTKDVQALLLSTKPYVLDCRLGN